MRYATSKAARVPVMCSEFIARTVRTAVPRRVPVSVLVPGRRCRGLPARSAHRRSPRAARARRSAARRVREPAGGSQGAGRADPGHGAGSPAGAGGHPGDRGGWALRSQAPPARGRRAAPTRSSSRGRSPSRTSPATTRWRTCSRCRAEPGSRAWRSKGGATCSSRPRRAAGRSSSATPAAPGRPWSTVRPGSWSTARTRSRSPSAVADLLADPDRARAMGEAGRARVMRDHTWPDDRRPTRGLAAGRGSLKEKRRLPSRRGGRRVPWPHGNRPDRRRSSLPRLRRARERRRRLVRSVLPVAEGTRTRSRAAPRADGRSPGSSRRDPLDGRRTDAEVATPARPGRARRAATRTRSSSTRVRCAARRSPP